MRTCSPVGKETLEPACSIDFVEAMSTCCRCLACMVLPNQATTRMVIFRYLEGLAPQQLTACNTYQLESPTGFDIENDNASLNGKCTYRMLISIPRFSLSRSASRSPLLYRLQRRILFPRPAVCQAYSGIGPWCPFQRTSRSTCQLPVFAFSTSCRCLILSFCIATYSALPRMRELPRRLSRVGVVPNTILSKHQREETFCVYTMLVARLLFSCCSPAESRNCMANPQHPKNIRYVHSFELAGNKKSIPGNIIIAAPETRVHHAQK